MPNAYVNQLLAKEIVSLDDHKSFVFPMGRLHNVLDITSTNLRKAIRRIFRVMSVTVEQ